MSADLHSVLKPVDLDGRKEKGTRRRLGFECYDVAVEGGTEHGEVPDVGPARMCGESRHIETHALVVI